MSIQYKSASRAVAIACAVIYSAICVHAQVALQQAVKLALANSPQVKTVQNDLEKANANLSVLRDIYIPSVTTSAGVGYTTGITLSVPTVFTVNAQSLVFSFQQRQYIRAAHEQIQASTLSMEEIRRQVQEDVVITYISLAQALELSRVFGQQYEFASRLVAIDEDRQHSGFESELEVMKARRGAAQIKLAQMETADNIQSLRGHLASLTGLPLESTQIVTGSIPNLPSLTTLMADDSEPIQTSPGLLAAQADALAKQQRARGDAQYTWRPQVMFGAQYGRVSPINNVSQFYNLHGNYNTTNVGIQIQIPLIDRLRRATAQQSHAEASRATLDLENLRAEQDRSRAALKRSLPELATRVDLAQLDFDIAQNELSSTAIEERSATGRPPLTPKDEQAAHIEERQKLIDLLDAKLKRDKATISYLRQSGNLSNWLETDGSTSISSGAPHD